MKRNGNTKKFWIALILTIASDSLAFAAESVMQQPSHAIIPSFGVTSFNLSGSGYSAKSGMSVGGSYAIKSSLKNVTWEVGAMYLQAGAKKDYFFFTDEITMSYIAVPLMARWDAIHYGENKSFYLKGGIVPTQLMSADQETHDYWNGTSQKGNIKDQVAKNDVHMSVGIGGTYQLLDSYTILTELNYMKGTQEVVKGTGYKSEGLLAQVSVSIPL